MKLENLNIQSERLADEISRLKKYQKEAQKRLDSQKEEFQSELTKKADKDFIAENQKALFQNLTKMESKSDESISKMVQEEIRKLSEQIVQQGSIVDKKLAKLKIEFDTGKIEKTIEKKAGRDEVKSALDQHEGKVKEMQKMIKRFEEQVKRIEVSTITGIA